MQCPSVERTFRNLLFVYGRGRRRCGGPTILAIRRCAFPLVGNAHLVGAMTAKLRPAQQRVTSARLSCSSSRQKVTLSSSRTAYRLRLRSSPRTLTPSFLLSEKSHAASLLLACKRARDAPTYYQLFSVLRGQVLCLFSCRERTPGVPRWKSCADDAWSVDGET